ncbi:MAG TPA: retropepsin-like aspartic protease [Ignavibacteria bacterium]|nr:retropepsin-like aspartic protease [Ignavibacteria bacterium]
MKLTIFLILVLAAGTWAETISTGQGCRERLSASNGFTDLLVLLENKDLFRFCENFDNTVLNDWERSYINALILNLRHKNYESNKTISEVIEKYGSELHDSLKMQLYETRMKNSVNLFDYKDALYCTEYILKNYASLLDSAEDEDMRNSMVIWKAAENIQKQSIVIAGDSKIPLKKDLAGLINIPVKCGGDNEDFIFDTGANFSVVNETYAKKMKLIMLEGSIEVGSVTGKKVKSKLACAELLEIGGMKLSNVLFLVLPDESLSFAGGLYAINGIIGFPVIKEMKEIHIRREEVFIPKEKTSGTLSNMLIDGFIPSIEIIDGNDSLAFTFDTGAKATMLYSSYYRRNKTNIESKYEIEEIEFGGAGGTIKVKGFRLDNIVFKIGNSKLKLDDVRVIAENIKDHDKGYFGNLGQDYMGEFNEMILNFEDMYVDFKK